VTVRVLPIVLAGAAWLLAAGLAAQTAPAQTSADTDPRFPPGPGRDALFKVCHDCHGPESVLANFKSRDEWRKTLDEMASNGAVGSDAEWTAILDYLAKYYSPVLINKAAAKELASALDIPASAAEAIVRARTERGPFKSIDEVKQVNGVDPARIDSQKDRLVF
jgi:competence protein ComEA